jgi:hypothetical protein
MIMKIIKIEYIIDHLGQTKYNINCWVARGNVRFLALGGLR